MKITEIAEDGWYRSESDEYETIVLILFGRIAQCIWKLKIEPDSNWRVGPMLIGIRLKKKEDDSWSSESLNLEWEWEKMD